jgi:hypothetical protein
LTRLQSSSPRRRRPWRSSLREVGVRIRNFSRRRVPSKSCFCLRIIFLFDIKRIFNFGISGFLCP